MKTSPLLRLAGFLVLSAMTLIVIPVAAQAQSSVIAEGKTTYQFNPMTGATRLNFSRISNYTYGNQQVHVALALTKSPYSAGKFQPNFAKMIGTLPARSYSRPLSVSGVGAYPKKGTYYVTVGIGVTNTSGGVSLISYLHGQKVKLGNSFGRSLKSHRSLKKLSVHGQLTAAPSLTVEIK